MYELMLEQLMHLKMADLWPSRAEPMRRAIRQMMRIRPAELGTYPRWVILVKMSTSLAVRPVPLGRSVRLYSAQTTYSQVESWVVDLVWSVSVGALESCLR